VLNACLGYIVSKPAIRLTGSYLIIVFIGMAEAVRVIGMNYYPLVGGTFWVHVPDAFAWMGSYRIEGYLLIAGLLTLITFLLIQSLSTSPLARVLRAIRENSVSAECVGKDVVGIRTKIVVLCSALTSVAGVLYGFYIHAVLSTSYTRATWTFYPWLMFMVGGVGNNIGATVGTFIFITLRRLIIFYKHSIEAYVPFQVQWLEQIMIGVMLLLIIIFRPQGLIPEKPTMMRGLNYEQVEEEMREKGVKVPEKQVGQEKTLIQRILQRVQRNKL
jgi:branched-chain amino acid transport system permease protein